METNIAGTYALVKSLILVLWVSKRISLRSLHRITSQILSQKLDKIYIFDGLTYDYPAVF